MIRLRGGRGLGDSIYLRPIAEHLLAAGHDVTILSDYPDVFLGLGEKSRVEPFSRHNVNVLAHYVLGKPKPGSNQWEDICSSAGVPGLALGFKWDVRNGPLVGRLREQAQGRPLLLVHGGRVPMGRTDGFGAELLPAQAGFLGALGGLCMPFLVRVGNAPSLYSLPSDVDLNEKASVADLLDLASTCDGIVGQCSFAIPLAEVFDKPLLVVWSALGLQSRTEYIRQITPDKVLSKPSSWAVMDNWPLVRIEHEVERWQALVQHKPEKEARTCAS